MKTIKKLPLLLSILSFLTIFTPVNAEIKVVATIKPIHSLASYLMDGVGKPDLIVDGYASPHGFALKPSHAKMIQNADIKVVASIKPIHSLASYLMDGVGKPDLIVDGYNSCLLYTSPSPRDLSTSRMPSSA